MRVFRLYLSKSSDDVKANKNKTIFNRDLRFSTWGLRRYYENVWQRIEKGDLIIIYDAEKEDLYISRIIRTERNRERSNELWNSGEFELILEFSKPIKIQKGDINREVYERVKESTKVQPQETFKEITNSEIIELVKLIYNRVVNMSIISDNNAIDVMSKLLLNSKQAILYGPPGTGKTLTAKRVAKNLILQRLNIQEILDEAWSNFVNYLHRKILRTKRGEEFICERTNDNSIKFVDRNASASKDRLKRFMERCWPNVEECSVEESESYIWSVAVEFKKYIQKGYIKDHIKLIQFHPSYTYEDFVRGIQVEIQNGIPVYRTVNRIFAEMCDKAINNPDKNFVLIIDEINRANLPAVLGELIYALEYRGEPVETPYEVNGSRTLIVPENLYIIGTMNTADRSIGHIDYAIRRRFYFLPVRANKRLIEDPKARELYENTIEKIFVEDNISPEFRDKIEDVKIGHTYFLGNNNEIAHKFVYQVIPLLVEYIQDGILKGEEVVQNVIQGYFEGVENWKELTVEAVINKL